MKKTALYAALAAIVVLAGCAVTGPAQTVPAGAPAAWYAPLPHDGKLQDLSAWWAQFDDALLVAIVDAAQAANPTVASARSRIEQARASRVAAGAALGPTLDASASASRGNTQPPAPLATVVQAGLQTAWEIDLFGGLRAGAAAAQSRFEGAQAGWHDARVAVAAEAATAYVTLRTCQRQLAVSDNDARSRAETARLSDLSAQAGFTAPADAALARASAAESAARAKQQRAQCELDVKALVALTAIPEPQLRERLAAPWKEPTGVASLGVATVPAQVLAQRPDVYQAEREVAAASADVGTARAQRFPRVTLAGSLAVGRARLGGSDTNVQTWSIGPLAVSLPLLDGGRRAANVDAAQARYDEAVALYTARVRQAVREVEQALVNLDSARQRGDDARAAADGFRAALRATQARYDSGLASLVELEEVRRTFLAAETALVTLQREDLTAWIALYRALGGGWPGPVARAAASVSTSSPSSP